MPVTCLQEFRCLASECCTNYAALSHRLPCSPLPALPLLPLPSSCSFYVWMDFRAVYDASQLGGAGAVLLRTRGDGASASEQRSGSATGSSAGGAAISAAGVQLAAGAKMPAQWLLQAVAVLWPPDGGPEVFAKHELAVWMLSLQAPKGAIGDDGSKRVTGVEAGAAVRGLQEREGRCFLLAA